MSSKEDDETTQPSVMPPQPKTVQLPAVDPVQVLLIQLKQSVDGIGISVSTLIEDGKGLNLRMAGIEGRVAKLESPSVPPLNRAAALALMDEHPSKSDLEHEALLSAEIVKNRERDEKIAETHALASAAAEELAKQSAELAKQSRAMGIGVAGLKWVVSKEGRATMTQLAILIGVLYGTLKGAGVLK